MTLLIAHAKDEDKTRFTSNHALLCKLALLDDIKCVSKEDELPASATSLFEHLELNVPLKGLVDVTQESKRLEKEITEKSIRIL